MESCEETVVCDFGTIKRHIKQHADWDIFGIGFLGNGWIPSVSLLFCGMVLQGEIIAEVLKVTHW